MKAFISLFLLIFSTDFCVHDFMNKAFCKEVTDSSFQSKSYLYFDSEIKNSNSEVLKIISESNEIKSFSLNKIKSIQHIDTFFNKEKIYSIRINEIDTSGLKYSTNIPYSTPENRDQAFSLYIAIPI